MLQSCVRGDLMNMTIVVALLGAWAAIFLLKRVIRVLLLRGVGRVVLGAIGHDALQRVPRQVALQKTGFPTWTHQAEVEKQAAPLRNEGFTDLGAYTVNTIPGVMIRMMAHPETYVAAQIYDHPKSGSWTEFVTRYTDGSSSSLSTLPPTGMDAPDWFRRIEAGKNVPTDQLYRQFLTQRESGNIKAVAPADTIREFEESYAKLMAWRQQRGVTPTEVARVAQDRLQKKQAAGTSL